MRELQKAKSIRYSIIMIILIISLMALLLAMNNYADIQEYKKILGGSSEIRYYEAIDERGQTFLIRTTYSDIK